AAGFQLKGSGWYATDFKGGTPAAAPAAPAAEGGTTPAPAAAPAADKKDAPAPAAAPAPASDK
ncbi:MAG: zinc ribbon domain-containing protein, partial [Rubrivivax sp.]